MSYTPAISSIPSKLCETATKRGNATSQPSRPFPVIFICVLATKCFCLQASHRPRYLQSQTNTCENKGSHSRDTVLWSRLKKYPQRRKSASLHWSHGAACSSHPVLASRLCRTGAVQGGTAVLVQGAGPGGPHAGGATCGPAEESWCGRGTARGEARAPQGPQDEQGVVGQPPNPSKPGNVSNYSLPQLW